MHPIHQLIQYALKEDLVTPLDIDYVFNRLCELFHLEDIPPYPNQPLNLKPLDEILNPLLNIILPLDASLENKDQLEAKIMDIFMPLPSDLQTRFDRLKEESPQKATQYFYHISQASNYIKTARILKNKSYQYQSLYGNIDITINLSKPEKDPRDIKKALNKSVGYPKCMLCKESVGYPGHKDFPARNNHRIIKIPINNEPFYFHYSPYSYYNEHAILIHEDHIPMKITRTTFQRLTDFVDRFPHYFMGSNAGLPIVGGSILSHEHYQGGCAKFPLNQAKTLQKTLYDDVLFERLYWPMSIIKVTTNSKEKIIKYLDKLRLFWEQYNDFEVDIFAYTDQAHNAITPILHKENGAYIFNIALRNNRTNETYPDGIFHIHENQWHIKKENIGLIEVMGLAILPPRLDEDLKIIKTSILSGDKIPGNLNSYSPLIEALSQQKNHQLLDETLEKIVAETFIIALEDCAVFKQNLQGEKHYKKFFDAFIKSLEQGDYND